jgi:hypothetical protein
MSENQRQILHLGVLGESVRVTYPPERLTLPERTPSVCSQWDKPEEIDLSRLQGLDLEDCAWLIRAPLQQPLSCSDASIRALQSAQIICLGTDATFANADALSAAGIVVLEGLALHDVPRVGFCLTIGESVTADVQKVTWTL